MLFTFVTIPHIILVKDLSFLELHETVLNTNITRLISLCINTTIDSLSFLHSGQVLDEILVESICEANVNDQVMLTSIVTIETNVIINTSFI